MVAFDGRPDVINRGTLRKSSNNATTIEVPVVNDGVVDLRAGYLNFTSGYTQTVDGRQHVELRGPDLLADYGGIQSNVPARLAGTVEVVTAPDFHPQLGDRFMLVSVSVGPFPRVEGAAPGPGLRYDVGYSQGQATLVVVSASAPAPAQFDPGIALATSAQALPPFVRPNRPPVARSERISLPSAAARTVRVGRLLANDADPDADSLRVALARQTLLPRGARVRLVAGVLHLSWRSKAPHALRVRYVVVDGRGARSSPATAVIRIPTARPRR
jgi:hypothetical protein